jgi:hypothetical protein
LEWSSLAAKKGQSGSGGVRPGAGRKRLNPEFPLEATKDFATRVLHRVGEKDWLTYADVSNVRSDEDLVLHLLANPATRCSTAHKLLDRKYGKPSVAGAVEAGQMETNVNRDAENSVERVMRILAHGAARVKSAGSTEEPDLAAANAELII